MKDYGGFGDEPFYDLDGNGKLDFIEESLMHADLDLQMMEMDNLPRSSGSSNRRRKNSFWHDFWQSFWFSSSIINVPTFCFLGWLSVLIAEVYGDTGQIFFFLLAVVILVGALAGLFIKKPQPKAKPAADAPAVPLYKRPRIIFAAVSLTILLILAGIGLHHLYKKQTYADRLHEIAYTIAVEDYQLQDVEITLYNTNLYRESFHSSIDLCASNLEAIGYPRLLRLYEDLPERAEEITAREFGIRTGYGLHHLRSGENEYEIYASTRSVYKNGVSVYDDFWHSENYKDYLERHPEAKANDTLRKSGLPHVGMPEDQIDSTSLGPPDGDVRHNYEAINGQQYRANIYDFSGPDGVIFTVKCVNGTVTQVWDYRDAP